MIRCNTQMRTLKNKQNKTQIDLNDVIVTITTKRIHLMVLAGGLLSSSGLTVTVLSKGEKS